MRFQDAARDGRAVVYQAIQADPLVARLGALLADARPEQRLLARAVMNGERTDSAVWRVMFPILFADPTLRDGSEAILAASLDVAAKGDQARSSYRGAVVEELTARLLGRRAAAVRRERRVLFDGVPTEIHPYDVTVESPGAEEIWDCKWGARGIDADVLYQLDDARAHAADEELPVRVGLVVFDASLSCEIRLERATAPHGETSLASLETLDRLALRH